MVMFSVWSYSGELFDFVMDTPIFIFNFMYISLIYFTHANLCNICSLCTVFLFYICSLFMKGEPLATFLYVLFSFIIFIILLVRSDFEHLLCLFILCLFSYFLL